jgi:hypothetical protein
MLPAICVGSTQVPTGVPVYVGRYTNGDYGFSVTVPKNLKAFGTPDPAPNHGFAISISEMPYSYLSVDASFAVGDYDNEQATPQFEMALLRNSGGANVRMIKQSRTRLGGLSGIHFVIGYELSGAPMVSETIWALLLPRDGGVGITYSINLRCAQERFDRDSKIVESLRRNLQVSRSRPPN